MSIMSIMKSSDLEKMYAADVGNTHIQGAFICWLGTIIFMRSIWSGFCCFPSRVVEIIRVETKLFLSK